MRSMFILAPVIVALALSVLPAHAKDDDSKKTTKKPWLGMALLLKDSPDGGKFLYVAHAPEEAPAYQSGIRPSDVITRIEGKPIAFRDVLDILEFTAALTPGQDLKVRLVREGKEQDLRVQIGVLPREYEPLMEESLKRAREERERKKE